MGVFQKYIENMRLAASSQVRRQLGDSYKPGTFGIEIEFKNPEGVLEDSLEEISDWFHQQNLPVYFPEKRKIVLDQWNIFEDEPSIGEIASPILTLADWHIVDKLLNYLKDTVKFSSGTGFHVHLGMPLLTDAFDLLAMAYLIDEKALLALAGREEWHLEGYAKEKHKLFRHLIDHLNGDTQVFDNKSLMNWLENILDKYFGVNTIDAFLGHGTVEIRYLSSQVVGDPSKVREIVEYFLLLPRLAQSRTQFKFKLGDSTLIVTRRMGGKVEFRVFAKEENPSVNQTNYPVSNLR